MPVTPWLERLLDISTFFVTTGAELMIQSTLIILAGLCLASVVRKHGAAVQSVVLRLFLVGVFACPLVSLLLDFNTVSVLEIDLPHASLNVAQTALPHTVPPPGTHTMNSGMVPRKTEIYQNSTIIRDISEVLSTGSSSPVDNDVQSLQPGTVSGKQRGSFPAAIIYIVLAFLWVSCTLFCIARLVVYYRRILAIRANAADAHPEVLIQGKELAYRMEVKTPLFLESDRARSPFLTGVIKPAVILPRGITATGEILIHELAHLVRRDCIWNLLSHVGIALLPFQPLMRLLSRRIEETSDFVCDDYVIKQGLGSISYAKQLASLAERFRPAPFEVTIGVGILSLKSSLLKRIERILGDSRQILVAVTSVTVLKIVVICMAITILAGSVGIRRNVFSSTGDNTFAIRPVAESSMMVDSPGLSGTRTPESENTIEPAPVIRRESEHATQAPLHRPLKAEASSPVPEKGSEIKEKSYRPLVNESEGAMSVVSQEPAALETALHDPSPGPLESLRRSDEAIPGGETPTLHDQRLSEEHTGAAHEHQVMPVKVTSMEAPVKQGGAEPSYVLDALLKTLTDAGSCKEAGMKLLKRGNNHDAETVFLKGFELEQNNPDILNCLGLACYAQAKIKEAKIFFKTAIAADKNFADAYYNLGDVLYDEGNLNAAMEQYKIALNLNPALSDKKRPFYLGEVVNDIQSHN